MLVQNNMISFLALFAQAVWATDLDHGPSHPNYPLAIFVEKNYMFILRRFPNIFTGYLSFKGSDPTGTHLLRFPPLSPSHPSLINSKDVQSIKVNNLKKFRLTPSHVFKPPPRSPGHQEKKTKRRPPLPLLLHPLALDQSGVEFGYVCFMEMSNSFGKCSAKAEFSALLECFSRTHPTKKTEKLWYFTFIMFLGDQIYCTWHDSPSNT